MSEGDSYATSLIVRRQLGLETTPEWLEAHPGIRFSRESGYLIRNSKALNNPAVKSTVEQLERREAEEKRRRGKLLKPVYPGLEMKPQRTARPGAYDHAPPKAPRKGLAD